MTAGLSLMATSFAHAAPSDYRYEMDSRPDTLMAGGAKIKMLCANDNCNPVNIEITHEHHIWTLEDWSCAKTPCNMDEVVAWHPTTRLISFQTAKGDYHLIQIVTHGLIDMGDGYTIILDAQHQVVKPAALVELPWNVYLEIKPDGRVMTNQKATCQALYPLFSDNKNALEEFLVTPQFGSTVRVSPGTKHSRYKSPVIQKYSSLGGKNIDKLQSLLSMSRYCGFEIDDAFHALVNRRDATAWNKASDGASEIGFWDTRTGSREAP